MEPVVHPGHLIPGCSRSTVFRYKILSARTLLKAYSHLKLVHYVFALLLTCIRNDFEVVSGLQKINVGAFFCIRHVQ
jgi:hypothetical protein